METNEVSQSAASITSGARKTEGNAAATAASDFETFLTLLTAQLRNQDPLAPVDSTQFVEQLASFSAVEQQIETNSRLETLAESLAVSDLAGATQWIGKQVEAESGAARFQGEPLSFVIPEFNDSDSSEVVISDQKGNEVFRQATDNQRQQLVWNGENNNGDIVDAGDYIVSINRIKDGEVTEVSVPVAITHVLEARLEGGSVQLVLDNGGTVDPNGILAVRAAQTPSEAERTS